MDKDGFENLRYFFSLALEDYIGNIEELMGMAGITDHTLRDFFEIEFESLGQNKNL